MLKINRPEYEQDRIDVCVGALAEAFAREPTDGMMNAYQIGLDGVPVESVERAAVEAIRTFKFMPKPVELRQLAGEKSPEDLSLERKSRAEAAWQCVCDATLKFNSYDHMDFDDGLINAAIRSLGGWPNLLSRNEKDFDTWAKKGFVEVYEMYLKTGGLSGDACRPLVGLSDTGVHEVLHHDGCVGTVNLGGPKRVVTGLPLLPGISPPPRIGGSLLGIGLTLRKVPDAK